MAKRKKTGDDDWMEGSWDVLEEENELELLRHLFSEFPFRRVQSLTRDSRNIAIIFSILLNRNPAL